MKNLLFLVFLYFTVNIAYCQADSSSTKTDNKVEVIKDGRIDVLNQTYNSSFQLKGYRVQIYSGSRKQPANQARARFMQLANETAAYAIYQQPYYKVRVGDFKKKWEALAFQQKIIKNFPSSFIVKDEIEYASN